ncbi:Gfo/Idh/MocA family protein [Synechococcus sp. GEYO]|uniref:Gfo/Idh/MocA family protein n=1 Tax=Synechococcus sp. GEYO TaxID=2575511 RepID=UPI000E0F8876|nr:Gfo/Idh/MocA family oxidoreductase [Synechococcus sp. GEYO]
MTLIRALLLGLGQMGCGYDLDQPFRRNQPCSGPVTWTHARALVCHPQVDLVAAVDPSAQARERFSTVYSCPVFADLEAYFQGAGPQEVDLVVIAVPPALQPSMVEQLLARCSPQMLLLEKPIAVNIEAAERLRQECKRHPKLVVAVNYIRRYLPVILELQSELQHGLLGRLLHGRLVYGKGLLSNGSHFVNLAEAWLGPLSSGELLEHGPTFASFDQEASLTLRASSHNDAVLNVQSIGMAGLRAGELDLWFSQGRLLWSNDGRSVQRWRLAEAGAGDSHRPLMAEPMLFPSGMEHYQHHVLHNLVRHGQQPTELPIHCDLNAGFKTLQLLERTLNACR